MSKEATKKWQQENKEYINQYNREYRAKRKALGLPVRSESKIITTQKHLPYQATCSVCGFSESATEERQSYISIRLSIYRHVRQTGHRVVLQRLHRTIYEKKQANKGLHTDSGYAPAKKAKSNRKAGSV